MSDRRLSAGMTALNVGGFGPDAVSGGRSQEKLNVVPRPPRNCAGALAPGAYLIKSFHASGDADRYTTRISAEMN
jgi:hypothetical protein